MKMMKISKKDLSGILLKLKDVLLNNESTLGELKCFLIGVKK